MESKIKVNWNKIEEIEKLVQEKTGDPEAGFNASSFFFGADGRHLMIPCMYRGKIARISTSLFFTIVSTFAPFATQYR